MAVSSLAPAPFAASDRLFEAAVHEGSAGHRYLAGRALRSGVDASRNLADAAHFLCMLHGRHPGVIDHASEQLHPPLARAWLDQAARGFAVERQLLGAITSAAGPQPSTTRHAESEAVVMGQRHALATLARSEREGCALGAAAALVLDWRAIRAVLDAAAERFGLAVPSWLLPDEAATRDLIDVLAEKPAVERAITFGSRQILIQHHGLWDLLEAREASRRE